MRLHFIFIMSTEERHVLMLEMSTQTNVNDQNGYLKRFLCTKEGIRDIDKRYHTINKTHAWTRRGCAVHLAWSQPKA